MNRSIQSDRQSPAASSSGRTAEFDSANLGSNPSVASIFKLSGIYDKSNGMLKLLARAAQGEAATVRDAAPT